MKKLNLLLLEDDIEEANDLADFLEDNHYNVMISHNSRQTERLLKRHSFDLVILDIMIDGKPEGIETANRMNELGFDIPFLFLSSMQTKILFDKAKTTKPITYLIKPYNELELLFTLELAIEKYYDQSNSISIDVENAVICPTYIFIKKKRSLMKVEVSKINYIEVQDKYCNFSLIDEDFLVKISLKKVKELLANPDFIQVHRNYLVNAKKIKEIFLEDSLIILETEEKIPFSERHKATFVKNNYLLK
ncbi:LytR/AlgR family response regulator transcription factor [Flavicella marina]|uniref:LytR/AlgR family response regulator transcription factor n=1 Tax=Flavicella marina TaxID=1475951 RepID=UPI0012643464|nr:response regulator transcription factor [Flavicella marina]